jgi:hypothetical protein
MKSLITISASITVVQAAKLLALTDAEESLTVDQLFINFKSKFNKSYPNKQEEARRKQFFIKTEKRIKSINSNLENADFKVGHNQFSDEDDNEKKKRFIPGPSLRTLAQ